MPVLPATITVQHQVWEFDSGTDADGNPTGSLQPAVNRKIIGFQQLNDGRVDPISPDYVERVITDLIMEVPDPTVYKKLDRVLVDNGNDWIAYEVQGRPPDWRLGLPWQRYSGLFGGTVHIRRVG